MEYIYAALLLHKLGKEITEGDVKSVVAAAGVHADESKIKSLVASLKGVNIEEELANASVTAVATPVAVEEKKAAPKEEKKEAAAEGLSALFG